MVKDILNLVFLYIYVYMCKKKKGWLMFWFGNIDKDFIYKFMMYVSWYLKV